MPAEATGSVVRDGCVAGAVAGLAAAAPSTLHALASGRDPLAATVAAGTLALPDRAPRYLLVAAGGVVHIMVSLAWGTALAASLPRRRTALAGAVAGAAIAALDLGVLGRRNAAIRALPLAPQLCDHLAYGAIAGVVVERRRLSREPGRSRVAP